MLPESAPRLIPTTFATAPIKDSKFEDMTLEDIVRAAAKSAKNVDLFHNAAQVWNHDFFWRSMRPQGGGAPSGQLQRMIARDFKDEEQLSQKLHETAVKQFGSGWAWLIFNRGKLSVVSTSNADTPLTTSATPLLAIDVWEHAYYLDHQNRRTEYVDAFLKHLINWNFAAERLNAAFAGSEMPVELRSAGRQAR
ncbi:MAG: superoxide dismutase [Alphaproteobacteria bacterium]|nr:superoxide dismutase [Alphaproteobacteria bacterium]